MGHMIKVQENLMVYKENRLVYLPSSICLIIKNLTIYRPDYPHEVLWVDIRKKYFLPQTILWCFY